MKSFQTTLTDDARIGAIEYQQEVAESSRLYHLAATTDTLIIMPLGAEFVRYSYSTTLATVFSSPEVIVLPAVGTFSASSAEPNAVIRYIGNLRREGLTTLHLFATEAVIVKVDFYTK